MGRHVNRVARRMNDTERLLAYDGRWYFVRRKHLLWYGSELGQSPLGLPPANWPEHQTGKGTLPESWDSWQRFWKE